MRGQEVIQSMNRKKWRSVSSSFNTVKKKTVCRVFFCFFFTVEDMNKVALLKTNH